ncbi:MAG: hypothetical protein Q8933_21730, partial [Bacteroidota bacterium]|nr:hypothetical protein [Bacteroidota bacterium]
MAEKKQTTTKRTYNKKTTEKKEEIKVEIPIVKEEAKEKVAPTIKERKKLDLTSMVACRNACKSRLVYVSKRQMGYEIVWENFGSIEWV